MNLKPLPPSAGHRRGFLAKLSAVLLAVIAVAVPVVTGLVTFLNPWRQRGAMAKYYRVTSLSSLSAGAPPSRFPVVSERSDAWNRLPAQTIGVVFLRRVDDKTVEAFQAMCPHAAGFVTFDAAGNEFVCPYHGARFTPDGARHDPHHCASPRDLDRLAVELRGDEVWVEYRTFATGTPQKIEEA
jgi:menaquinol-cytochrome c reductase iron-sulfur subunit